MNGFLDAIGKHLAEKWLTRLAIPGSLCLAVLLLLVSEGRGDLFESALPLSEKATRAINGTRWPLGLLIAFAWILAASSLGLVASASQACLEALWLRMWPWPLRSLATARTSRRQKRWNGLWQQLRSEPDAAKGEALRDRIRRVSAAMPQRPTWMGDRLCEIDAVVHQEYGLDFRAAWPRLWLLVAAETRGELQNARLELDRAIGLAGWGLTYSLIAVVAIASHGAVLLSCAMAIGGICLLTLGWRRARARLDEYADLVEATIDLHCDQLALSLAVQDLERDTGLAISRLLRKGR